MIINYIQSSAKQANFTGLRDFFSPGTQKTSIRGGEKIRPLDKDKTSFSTQKAAGAKSAAPVKPQAKTLSKEDKYNYALAVAAADEALRGGKFAEAVVDYTKAISIDDSQGPIFYKRGISNEYSHQYGNAIEDFTSAIAKGNSDPETFVRRGETRMYTLFAFANDGGKSSLQNVLISLNTDPTKDFLSEEDKSPEKMGKEKTILLLAKGASKDFRKALLRTIPAENLEAVKAEITAEKGANGIKDFKNYIPYFNDPRILDKLGQSAGEHGGETLLGAMCFERSAQINEERAKVLEEALEEAPEEAKESLEAQLAKVKTDLKNEYYKSALLFKASENAGEEKFSQKQYEALKKWQKLTGEDNLYYHAWVAQCAPDMGERIEEAHKALQFQPENPALVDLLAQTVKKAEESNFKFETLSPETQKAANEIVKDAKFNRANQEGDVALQAWKLPEAIKYYTQALEEKLSGPIFYKRGIAQEYSENLGGAILDFTSAIENGNENDAETFVRRGETRMYTLFAFANKGEDKKVAEEVATSLQTDPTEEYKEELIKTTETGESISPQKTRELLAKGAMKDFKDALVLLLDKEKREEFRAKMAETQDREAQREIFLSYIPEFNDTRSLDKLGEAAGFHGGDTLLGALCFERSSQINEEAVRIYEEALESAQEEAKPAVKDQLDKIKNLLGNEYYNAAISFKNSEGQNVGAYDEKIFTLLNKWHNLTGAETADYHARLAGSAPTAEERVEEALRAIQMEPVAVPFYYMLFAATAENLCSRLETDEEKIEFMQAIDLIQDFYRAPGSVNKQMLENAKASIEKYNEKQDDAHKVGLDKMLETVIQEGEETQA